MMIPLQSAARSEEYQYYWSNSLAPLAAGRRLAPRVLFLIKVWLLVVVVALLMAAGQAPSRAGPSCPGKGEDGMRRGSG